MPTAACTRGFDYIAQFSCQQSELLQSTSRIFNGLCCDAIKLQAILMIGLEVEEVILRWWWGGREGGGGEFRQYIFYSGKHAS